MCMLFLMSRHNIRLYDQVWFCSDYGTPSDQKDSQSRLKPRQQILFMINGKIVNIHSIKLPLGASRMSCLLTMTLDVIQRNVIDLKYIYIHVSTPITSAIFPDNNGINRRLLILDLFFNMLSI